MYAQNTVPIGQALRRAYREAAGEELVEEGVRWLTERGQVWSVMNG